VNARPSWEPAIRRLLGRSAERALVLPACTPTNLGPELARLRASFAATQPRAPRFEYLSVKDTGEQQDSLLRAADDVAQHGALASLYAERAREVVLEMRICSAVGGADFYALARRRYATGDVHGRRADALANAWLDAPEEPEEMTTTSDDPADPRSLLSRMRAEAGRRRLPMYVKLSDRLSALAATGAGVVYVATGKRLSVRAVERIVLHEIEGHAVPRARAAKATLAIFGLGTARGADEQEGRALVLERQAGLLDVRRRKELARRHLACRSLERGADFVETVNALRNNGTTLDDALRIAARVYRGGGLGREIVYLPAMLRVEQARCDAVLSMGQVSVAAAEVLQPFVQGTGLEPSSCAR
jgi:hypothetical protein